MPIYEYECLNCGARFELLRGINDSDRGIKCPKCGREKVRRVFSTFATTGGGSCAPSSPT